MIVIASSNGSNAETTLDVVLRWNWSLSKSVSPGGDLLEVLDIARGRGSQRHSADTGNVTPRSEQHWDQLESRDDSIDSLGSNTNRQMTYLCVWELIQSPVERRPACDTLLYVIMAQESGPVFWFVRWPLCGSNPFWRLVTIFHALLCKKKQTMKKIYN
jgi:hypothetical protein